MERNRLLLVVAVLALAGAVVGLRHKEVCGNPGSCPIKPTLLVENGLTGTFMGQEVTPPQIDDNEVQLAAVLGSTTPAGEKRIYVDLEKQTLKAYEGSKLILDTLISSGKWGRTPPGEYEIWVKMRATRMSGGSGNDAYDLPNVPYTMFFYGDGAPKSAGFALHGAYWHNNFGYPMSHGCVNMREVDAKIIYEWASPVTEGRVTYADAENKGTKIIIF